MSFFYMNPLMPLIEPFEPTTPRVPDPVAWTFSEALNPTLAISQGSLFLMSTPGQLLSRELIERAFVDPPPSLPGLRDRGLSPFIGG